MTMLAEIYAKLPHAGDMRLLEQVLHWDEQSIVCATSSHRSSTNPLRRNGQLAAVHGVEYAAQAAAVHGVLSAALDAGPLLLMGAVRDLELAVSRLDELPEPLRIQATLEARAGVNAVYRFLLDADQRTCAQGRITLIKAAGGSR
jgi:predicted hotdog family 3-hydroxylacyl-ACP dehydratase